MVLKKLLLLESKTETRKSNRIVPSNSNKVS
jgi:hypothetical protein